MSTLPSERRTAAESAAPLRALFVGAILLGGFAACGGDSIAGPGAEACGPPPYFNVLPVPESDLLSVPVVGGLDAPGHVLPTGHGGLFLARENVPLSAPGDMAITQIRRVRYLGPGVPPGQEDYAIFFRVCRDVTGWFGHVASLAPGLSPASLSYGNCQTYSVPWATVESCETRGLGIEVSAGDALGAGGPVIDMGVRDDRVTNFYVSPHRFGGPNHAVCMWEQFDEANRVVLFSLLRDPVRPHVTPSGEPRCGTMEVDVPGMAKGVWAGPGVGPVGGDERGYMVLANYPYRPQLELALSLGPEALGARLVIVERETAGRVNRAFEGVGPDGLIYCYGPQINGSPGSSWLVQMTSATELRIERVERAPGDSPCGEDPATWSFGPSAVSMVR